MHPLPCAPRSTSDVGSKTRMAESAGPEPAQLHDSASFAQVSRGPVSVAQLDQSALNYSGGQAEKPWKKPRCSLHSPAPPDLHRPPATCHPQQSRPLLYLTAAALAGRAAALFL